MKNKFHQYVISKFNEEDRLCYNSNKHNYTFTGGLDITKIKNNIVYGEYILYGANAPNCCPEYGGNFEYNVLSKKIQFKNEYYNSFLEDKPKYNSDKSKLGYYKVISNKAFFYAEPQEATKKSSYLIKGNKVDIKNYKGNFGYVEYRNTQGKTTKGWLRLSDIILIEEDAQAIPISKQQKEKEISQQKMLLEQQRIAESIKKAEQERLARDAEEKKAREQKDTMDNLKGRTWIKKPNVYDNSGVQWGTPGGYPNGNASNTQSSGNNILNKTGKVVIDIKVDREGNIIYAKYQPNGSTTKDEYLIQLSEKAALKAKFNPDPSAPEEAKGSISFKFSNDE